VKERYFILHLGDPTYSNLVERNKRDSKRGHFRKRIVKYDKENLSLRFKRDSCCYILCSHNATEQSTNDNTLYKRPSATVYLFHGTAPDVIQPILGKGIKPLFTADSIRSVRMIEPQQFNVRAVLPQATRHCHPPRACQVYQPPSSGP